MIHFNVYHQELVLSKAGFNRSKPLTHKESWAFVKRILRRLDCSYSLIIYTCLETGTDFSSLPMPDPMGYNDADTFARNMQAWSLLRKSAGFMPAPSTDNDYASLIASENQCAATNARLRADKIGSPLLRRVAARIKRILSDAPDYDSFLSECCYTSGASASLPRRKSNPTNKVLETPIHCTAAAAQFVPIILNDDDLMRDCQPDNVCYQVENARGTFVEKDFRSNRAIAIEPTFNMFLQKGIGRLLSQRLKAHGLHIPTQQLKNSRLAYYGSKNNSLCTVDLKAASDTVARELVYRLLPPDWYRLIALTRTPTISYASLSIPNLEKISSMGNGYTFELETLIFFALAIEVQVNQTGGWNRKLTAVYGDDIIIPAECYPALESGLIEFGFTINREKTFHTGPFRESCGAFYFMGRDVKPRYLRALPTTIQDSIVFLNAIVNIAENFGFPDILSAVYSSSIKIYAPYGASFSIDRVEYQTGVWVPNTILPLLGRRRFGWDGYWLPGCVVYVQTEVCNDTARLAVALRHGLRYTLAGKTRQRMKLVYFAASANPS